MSHTTLESIAEHAHGMIRCMYLVVESLSLVYGQLTRSLVTIASRTCLIAADLLVLCVTWRATYRATQMARASGDGGKRTFSGTLLRDGELCQIASPSSNLIKDMILFGQGRVTSCE